MAKAVFGATFGGLALLAVQLVVSHIVLTDVRLEVRAIGRRLRANRADVVAFPTRAPPAVSRVYEELSGGQPPGTPTAPARVAGARHAALRTQGDQRSEDLVRACIAPANGGDEVIEVLQTLEPFVPPPAAREGTAGGRSSRVLESTYEIHPTVRV